MEYFIVQASEANRFVKNLEKIFSYWYRPTLPIISGQHYYHLSFFIFSAHKIHFHPFMNDFRWK